MFNSVLNISQFHEQTMYVFEQSMPKRYKSNKIHIKQNDVNVTQNYFDKTSAAL